MNTKKIAIIGPESTGKSTLCEQLATHYRAGVVTEYARTHLEQFGANYTYEDLLTIAKKQLESEEKEAKSNKKILFVDTDMYVMKVWCEVVFEKCHSWILNKIGLQSYSLYLLMSVDLPWVKDNLREYPAIKMRKRLFHTYRDILINQHTPWVCISGMGKERINQAIHAINKYCTT